MVGTRQMCIAFPIFTSVGMEVPAGLISEEKTMKLSGLGRGLKKEFALAAQEWDTRSLEPM